MHQSIFGKTLVLVALGVLVVDAAQAFNFGNMMNPSRWWGGDKDRHDDYYGAPPYGYGYPAPGYAAPGYAVPAYTAPAYTAPGYTAPGYGYAAPGYAAPGYAAPGYAAPAVTAPAPAARAPAPAPAATSAGDDEAEIARLKQRLNELEAAGAAQAPPAPHPYEQDYRFPEAAQGGGSRAAAAPAAAPAAPEYPVYSPFGPPADFPPVMPDDESTPSQIEAVPVPPEAAPPAPVADTDAAPSDSPVTFSPYGNPADYVPPVQEMGQRVYEFGK